MRRWKSASHSSVAAADGSPHFTLFYLPILTRRSPWRRPFFPPHSDSLFSGCRRISVWSSFSTGYNLLGVFDGPGKQRAGFSFSSPRLLTAEYISVSHQTYSSTFPGALAFTLSSAGFQQTSFTPKRAGSIQGWRGNRFRWIWRNASIWIAWQPFSHLKEEEEEEKQVGNLEMLLQIGWWGDKAARLSEKKQIKSCGVKTLGK